MIRTVSEARDERKRIVYRQDLPCFVTQKDSTRVLDSANLHITVAEAGAPAQLAKWKLGALLDDDQESVRTRAVNYFLQMFSYGADAKMGVMLIGNTSTGKSSLATAALRLAAQRGFTIKFLSYEAFVQLHKDEMNLSMNASKYEDYADRMDEIEKEQWLWREVYEVLVVDDIFRTEQPKIFREKMHELLRSRFDRNVYTIVTTNLQPGLLREMDPRMFDFLFREYTTFAFGPDDNVVPVKRGKQ